MNKKNIALILLVIVIFLIVYLYFINQKTDNTQEEQLPPVDTIEVDTIDTYLKSKRINVNSIKLSPNFKFEEDLPSEVFKYNYVKDDTPDTIVNNIINKYNAKLLPNEGVSEDTLVTYSSNSGIYITVHKDIDTIDISFPESQDQDYGISNSEEDYKLEAEKLLTDFGVNINDYKFSNIEYFSGNYYADKTDYPDEANLISLTYEAFIDNLKIADRENLTQNKVVVTLNKDMTPSNILIQGISQKGDIIKPVRIKTEDEVMQEIINGNVSLIQVHSQYTTKGNLTKASIDSADLIYYFHEGEISPIIILEGTIVDDLGQSYKGYFYTSAISEKVMEEVQNN